MPDPVVEARAVRKTYTTGPEPVHALRDVDLQVHAGEFIAVVGPSGCGKTTLLNCLSGLDDVTKGSVHVEGRDLAGMSDDDRSRHRAERMGFVFQSYNLLPVLTAVENVELPLLVSGTEREVARERALELLDAVGLGDRGEHKPSELSGGQQQRVTIARSLVNDPAIVWADEPTGNLDQATGKRVLDLLTGLNRTHGQTLVAVTHDPNLAERAERVLHMESGELVRDTPRRI